MNMDSYRNWPSLPAMFFDCAEREGGKPFLWAKSGGDYVPISYRETADRIRRLAGGLRRLGIRPKDRVVIASENRPEWLIADVAIMAVGAVSVPAYTTNTTNDHRHILGDSGAKLAIVSNAALAEPLIPACREADGVEGLISIEPLAPVDGLEVTSWDDALAGSELAEPVPAGRGDLACLIYTSGTGGRPKGVMLSHGAILFNCMGAYELLTSFGLGEEVFLSFLPLSHSYEHTVGQFFPMSIGAQIYYAEGIDALARNMTEARPTIMTAVPRLYETMHGRIISGLRTQPALRRKLFARTVALGRKAHENPGSLGPIERIQNAVLDRLVRAKVRGRFGGRIKALVSGGAPLNVEIGLFFTALGLRLLQGYGQTETAPIVSCNRPELIKIDTVGPPVAEVEVRIAEDGEILVRGELAMLGYWNLPGETAEVLRDGWVHTGDIGEMDADGYIRITDRKKDLIVNSGGDNISPQRVEGFLTLRPEIAQAMVVGDRQPFLAGLIVPDADAASEWARANGRPTDLGTLCADEDFRLWIEAAVERVNADLSVIERVRRIHLVAEAFATDNGLLTPSLKIRRHAIGTKYGDALAALY